MGLLDDAIREHLELKRRRGADPGEVAREQQEALDLVPGGGAAGTGVGAPPSEHGEPFDAVGSTGDVTGEVGDGSAFGADALTDKAPPMAASDETAELDMSAVLAEDGPAEDTQLPGTSPAAHPSGSGADEELLEWEVPGDADDDQADESAEDVLEETPEFLRDTPEQDRLWFEQRPPRDFDFDK